jgi:hypothetical protein
VAHLDTVFDHNELTHDWYWYADPAHNLIHSPTLDDRLGVYTLCVLSQYAKFDLLLTENEESMYSSAQFFTPPRQYNWIFEPDRAGRDVVMYQYDSKAMRKRLKRVGFDVGSGTYSDICELEHLHCKAFNFGIGYRAQHTYKCHMYISDWEYMTMLFMKFYHENHDKYFYHEQQQKPVNKYHAYNQKSAYYIPNYQWRYAGEDEWKDWSVDEWSKWMHKNGG